MDIFRREPLMLAIVALAAVLGAVLVLTPTLDPSSRGLLVGAIVVVAGLLTRTQVSPANPLPLPRKDDSK